MSSVEMKTCYFDSYVLLVN